MIDEALSVDGKSLLKAGESLDDLYRCGLKLIQQPRFFCLGSDSVLLADFADIRPDDRVLEIGCGNGGVLLLLWAKTQNACYTGVEIMPQNADLAARSLRLNGLQNDIKIVCADFRQWSRKQCRKNEKYDKIICNPPYRPFGSGRLSPTPEQAAACFELNGTLAELLTAAAAVLKTDGSLTVVLPAHRLTELKTIGAACGLGLRRLQKVLAKNGEKAVLVLAELGFRQVAGNCRQLPDVKITTADEIALRSKTGK